MKAIMHEANPGYTWVRLDNEEWELGEKIYLSPKDDINNYKQVLPKPIEQEEETGE